MPKNYAQTELDGSRRVGASLGADPEDSRLLAQSVVAVSIPEYDSFFNHDGKRIATMEEARSYLKKGDLAAQVYRLSTSSRRLAFTDNPAFGSASYLERPELLRQARIYFGRLVGDLLIRETSPTFHDSLHAENLVYFPVFKKLLPTDFADMPGGFELGQFLNATPEYGIFLDKPGDVGSRDFHEGLRSSLEPRGLWTEPLARLANGSGTEHNGEELLEWDLIYPLRLKELIARNKRKPSGSESVLPALINKFIYHEENKWLDETARLINDTKYSIEWQDKRIEKNVKKLNRGLTHSSLSARYFSKEMPSVGTAVAELSKVLVANRELAKQMKNRTRVDSLRKAKEEVLELVKQEATIYDSLSAAFGFAPNSRAAVERDLRRKP